MAAKEVIQVVCGIIIKENKVLVAQRNYNMKIPLKWEFPGGKKKIYESDRECLERELFEELNILIAVKEQFGYTDYEYDFSSIRLTAYLANYLSGTILIYEHLKAEWVTKDELLSLAWAPADLPIVHRFIESNIIF